jgi:glucose/arabinose dehydrogenase
MRRISALLLALAPLAVPPTTVSPALAAVSVPTNFLNEPLVSGLNQPNSLCFLPGGRILFTEQRTGKVRMFVNGHLSLNDPLAFLPGLNTTGYERGLQGIAVDPGWPGRPYVYIYYTATGGTNKLVRYSAFGAVSDTAGETIGLGSPYVVIGDLPDNNPNHNSGCLRFAPDGSLFVSVGDDEDFCSAPDPTALKGKLLRLRVDGLPAGAGGPPLRADITPEVNPYIDLPDSNAHLVYALGMRNPWRYQIDRVSGYIYLVDVGEADVEEIDEVWAGNDLGFPWREGNMLFARPTCPEPGGSGAHPYTHPIVATARGPELTAFISAGRYRPVKGGALNWPATYNGNVFYGEYFSGVLRRIENSTGSWLPAAAAPGQPTSTEWATGLVSASEFVVGPDGSLYWLAQFDNSLAGATGTLNRIRYTGPQQPAAVAPGEASRLAVFPNPFSTQADIGFTLDQREHARLTIYDLLGRKVRTLFDGEASTSETHVAWDGTDEDHHRVAAGVYLARLTLPSGTFTTHLMHIP